MIAFQHWETISGPSTTLGLLHLAIFNIPYLKISLPGHCWEGNGEGVASMPGEWWANIAISTLSRGLHLLKPIWIPYKFKSCSFPVLLLTLWVVNRRLMVLSAVLIIKKNKWFLSHTGTLQKQWFLVYE